MALNYSHPTIFPAHLPEDNMVSPFMIANSCLMEGVPEMRGDGYAWPWHSAREMHNFFESGDDSVGAVDSQESVSEDILSLLPADPFGMDMSTTFTAAIKGLLEDLEVDCGFGGPEVGSNGGDCPLFVGWNLIWNNALGFGSSNPMADKSGSEMGISSCYGMAGILKMGDAIYDNKSASCSETVQGVYADCYQKLKVDDNMQMSGHVSCHATSNSVCNMDDSCFREPGIYSDDNESPHNAFIFALGYLGAYDLLSVERVCKSLCCIVQNDPLLWRNIHIDERLSERITDDILLLLTDRAQGKLQSLSLVECTKITDGALKDVLKRNSSLTKLSVSGCTRLSIDGVLNCLKTFNSAAVSGIKHLRIGGIYGMTERHFEDLKAVMGINNPMTVNAGKPHFYRRGNFFLSVEDDRAIDIEVCPRCQNFRLLYDCPVDEHSVQMCRGCIICIPRCVNCGRCINDGEFEETFCLELLCSVCGEQSLDCQGEIKASKSTHCKYHEAAPLSLPG
ncbi:hypothetical protein V2J09_019898 [Rumex salicifolius]